MNRRLNELVLELVRLLSYLAVAGGVAILTIYAAYPSLSPLTSRVMV